MAAPVAAGAVKTAVVLKKYWKELIFAALAVMLAPLLLFTSIGNAVTKVPFVSPEQILKYQSICSSKPITVPWYEVVAFDAIRLSNDFNGVSDSDINSSVNKFWYSETHTTTNSDGTTSSDTYYYLMPLDQVMDDEGFSDEEIQTASEMANGLLNGGGSGVIVPIESAKMADIQTLLNNPRVQIYQGGRNDLANGVIDARVVAILNNISQRHTIVVSCLKTGHSQNVNGTNNVSNHWVGRGVDIAIIDGLAVWDSRNNTNSPAYQLSLEILSMLPPAKPSELGGPWQLPDLISFTNSDHLDHLHIGWDG